MRFGMRPRDGCAPNKSGPSWRPLVRLQCKTASRRSPDLLSPIGCLGRKNKLIELDPLKESPASIIDRKVETVSSYSGYYGYQKPDPPFRFPKPIWRMT